MLPTRAEHDASTRAHDPGDRGHPRCGTVTALGARPALECLVDDFFDAGPVFHGSMDYLRDCELIAYRTADPRTGAARPNVLV